jgi:cytochrome P450
LLEGPTWKKHRKIISKGFDYDKIDMLIPTIISSINQKIQ